MRLRFPILLVVAGLALAACQAKAVSSFPWVDLQGRPLAFSSSATSAEDRLEPSADFVRYRLNRPYSPAKGVSLAVDLDFEGIGRINLDVVDAKGKVLTSFDFGTLDTSMRLLLPLPASTRLSALDLRCSPAQGAPKSLAILRSIAFVPAFRGLSKGAGRTLLSSDFSLVRSGGKLVALISRPFEDLVATDITLPAIRLAWKAGSAKGSIGLVIPGQRPRHISIRPEADSILLPETWFDRMPASVEFDAPPDLEILECSSSSIPRSQASVLDLGVVLGLPPTPGRPFDAYRWDAKPSVLVLDFADYATQSASLKRLAFFVEKAGFRGKLASDAEIAPLHGWNAHDYRAADLAAFFSKAKQSAFPLGAPELAVRDLLLGAGIIRESGPSYGAGEGALISIARESPPYLRATFMAHEASHALYFTDGDFSDFVRRTWAGVDKDERWFWKLYFGWMNYDTTDEDLMATEFMAYLLQQPLSHVEEYFTKTLPSRLTERHPDLTPRIDEWMTKYGGSFLLHATELEAWLRERYGFVAARPWSLY